MMSLVETILMLAVVAIVLCDRDCGQYYLQYSSDCVYRDCQEKSGKMDPSVDHSYSINGIGNATNVKFQILLMRYRT